MFFKALVFQGPGFSESRFFRVQIFRVRSRVQVQDLGSCSRSRVQGLGPGYRSNLIQEGEVILKKNPAVGLPEVSQLTDLVISKRQGDQRKHSFLEEKTP